MIGDNGERSLGQHPGVIGSICAMRSQRYIFTLVVDEISQRYLTKQQQRSNPSMNVLVAKRDCTSPRLTTFVENNHTAVFVPLRCSGLLTLGRSQLVCAASSCQCCLLFQRKCQSHARSQCSLGTPILDALCPQRDTSRVTSTRGPTRVHSAEECHETHRG